MQASDLENQRRTGHRCLRFMPSLETAYRQEREANLPERARPVAASATALFLIYAILDPALLPAELAQQTVLVRLILTCPVILSVWLLSYVPISPRYFARWYAFSYVWGGLNIVLIIALARHQAFPMPYDGILLILMFGYFVMGLPFRTASAGSAIIIFSYLGMEAAFGTPSGEILLNAFFLITANLIGMVGAWLSEQRQRAHFLDRHLLELSREQAEADSAAKTHLISVASHDLRQPLNVVNLLLENLAAADLSDEQRPLVHRLRHSVSHFNGLLGSLLDISRIQENMVRPVPGPLSVNTALQQVAEAVREDAAEQGIELDVQTCAPELAVHADPHLLHRILQNLASNAIQHSGASQITLGMDAGERRHRLWVRDDGCGMSEAEQTRVFETFYRAQATQTGQQGLGLGLAITRELTDMMQGDYGVVSWEDLGSTFWISLPAATAAAAAAEPTPTLAAGPDLPPGETVLLVEDDDEARLALEQILQRWGFRVVSAANGSSARQLAGQGPFDLAIIDLHLPDISGEDLYRSLRNRQTIHCGVLITADTAQKQTYQPAECLWVMHKPIVPSRLRAVLLRLQRAEAI